MLTEDRLNLAAYCKVCYTGNPCAEIRLVAHVERCKSCHGTGYATVPEGEINEDI